MRQLLSCCHPYTSRNALAWYGGFGVLRYLSPPRRHAFNLFNCAMSAAYCACLRRARTLAHLAIAPSAITRTAHNYRTACVPRRRYSNDSLLATMRKRRVNNARRLCGDVICCLPTAARYQPAPRERQCIKQHAVEARIQHPRCLRLPDAGAPAMACLQQKRRFSNRTAAWPRFSNLSAGGQA